MESEGELIENDYGKPISECQLCGRTLYGGDEGKDLCDSCDFELRHSGEES